MASYPTYGPGLFVGGIGEQDWDDLNDPLNHNPLNNRAVMTFAPGSIFKIITAYAGLSENVISQGSRVFCSGIWLGLGEEFPRWCWARGGHGSLEILGGIKNSCDVFFYEIGYRLFSKSKNIEELLQKYSRIFGLGSPTGIDLPFEDSGIIPDKQWKKEYFKDQVEYSVWFPGDTVSMAIGQGDILVSPLQMAMVYSTVANRGIQYRPHLVKEIKDYMGNLYTDGNIEEYEDLDLDENHIDLIEKGFQLVVGPGGTAAYSFRNFPTGDIPVAGKTSTAEVYGKQDYAWFASYAPVGNPRYVIVVILEEGGGGGSNVAPIVEKIYRYLFNID
jgi:penicillin-binding protein 2